MERDRGHEKEVEDEKRNVYRLPFRAHNIAA
jgi:hypothetical protein